MGDGRRVLRAPGKLFWIGEYAVLDGGPALVAAVDRAAVVRVESPWSDSGSSGAGAADVTFVEGGNAYPLWSRGGALPVPLPRRLSLVDAVVRTLDEAGVRPAPMRVSVDSAELAAGHKLGLGSSGAVAAGLVAALVPEDADLSTATEGGDTNVDARLALALAAHTRFQGGLGSGADVIASSLGGLVEVRAGVAPRRVAMPEGLRWAALAVGEPANTRTLVAAFRDWETSSLEGSAMVSALAALARAGIDALESGDIAEWCRAVRAYADHERAMTRAGVPIVTPAVEACVQAAERAGWAAKPSGAGGGDVVVAFAPASVERGALDAECAAAGVDVLELAVAAEGVLGSW